MGPFDGERLLLWANHERIDVALVGALAGLDAAEGFDPVGQVDAVVEVDAVEEAPLLAVDRDPASEADLANLDVDGAVGVPELGRSDAGDVGLGSSPHLGPQLPAATHLGRDGPSTSRSSGSFLFATS